MITQKNMANFLGISQQFLTDIKLKRRALGKNTALRVSAITGIPFPNLMFLTGEKFMDSIRKAMKTADTPQPTKTGKKTGKEK